MRSSASESARAGIQADLPASRGSRLLVAVRASNEPHQLIRIDQRGGANPEQSERAGDIPVGERAAVSDALPESHATSATSAAKTKNSVLIAGSTKSAGQAIGGDRQCGEGRQHGRGEGAAGPNARGRCDAPSAWRIGNRHVSSPHAGLPPSAEIAMNAGCVLFADANCAILRLTNSYHLFDSLVTLKLRKRQADSAAGDSWMQFAKAAPEAKKLRRQAGTWLKELRGRAGLSQIELAERLGLKYYTFVSQVENGFGRVPDRKHGGMGAGAGRRPFGIRAQARVLLRSRTPSAAVQGEEMNVIAFAPKQLQQDGTWQPSELEHDATAHLPPSSRAARRAAGTRRRPRSAIRNSICSVRCRTRNASCRFRGSAASTSWRTAPAASCSSTSSSTCWPNRPRRSSA